MWFIKVSKIVKQIIRSVSSFIIFPIVQVITLPKMYRISKDPAMLIFKKNPDLRECTHSIAGIQAAIELRRARELMILHHGIQPEIWGKIKIQNDLTFVMVCFNVVIYGSAYLASIQPESNIHFTLSDLKHVGIASGIILAFVSIVTNHLYPYINSSLFLNLLDQIFIPLQSFCTNYPRSLLREQTLLLNAIRMGDPQRASLLQQQGYAIPSHISEIQAVAEVVYNQREARKNLIKALLTATTLPISTTEIICQYLPPAPTLLFNRSSNPTRVLSISDQRDQLDQLEIDIRPESDTVRLIA